MRTDVSDISQKLTDAMGTLLGGRTDESLAELLEAEVLPGLESRPLCYQVVLQAAWRLRRAQGGSTNGGR